MIVFRWFLFYHRFHNFFYSVRIEAIINFSVVFVSQIFKISGKALNGIWYCAFYSTLAD